MIVTDKYLSLRTKLIQLAHIFKKEREVLGRYLRIDFNKNTKLIYYIKSLFILVIAKAFFSSQRKQLIKDAKKDPYLVDRVNYYNKTTSFEVNNSAKNYTQFLKEKKKTYFFDLLEILKYFPSQLKFNYLFGDIIDVPSTPSFLKSRPIDGDNQNSVVMKLNKIRHFIFVKDDIAFEDKKDMLVWRGKCYREHRQKFVQNFYDNPLCNIGQTNTKGEVDVPWQKEKLSLKKQLHYKFILAIEGNDVASNLKWAMSSNSLVMMTQPKFETWFMEGRLQANTHFVLLKDDYSDLEEKVLYYSEHIDKAKEIIKNANNFTSQFLDKKREKTIALLVMQKYFENAGQLND